MYYSIRLLLIQIVNTNLGFYLQIIDLKLNAMTHYLVSNLRSKKLNWVAIYLKLFTESSFKRWEQKKVNFLKPGAATQIKK